jgi:uncharacterized protein
MTAFLAVLIVLVGGVHYYLWQRLVRSPDLGGAWQRSGTLLFIALAVMTPAGIFLARSLPRSSGTVVATVVYTWFGVAILLFFTLLGSEVLRGAVRIFYALANDPLDPGRRVVLSRGIAGLAGVASLGLAGFGVASALGQVGVSKVRVPLSRLPNSLSGFRIAQLSDLHIGPTLGKSWLASVVATVNAEKPDLVVITGDLVDGSVKELREHVAPLRDLVAEHGVFFVTGNHEYYSGVDEWLSELGRLGVRVLRNERVAIGSGEGSFDLAGVDDWSAHRFGGGHGADLKRALAGRDPSRELVLLAHQPKQVLEAAERGVGLQLSGHTHGGQIFPWNFLVRLDQPYVAGLDRLRDTMIYVSRGTGYWGPPMRVGAPPEIALLELASASS